jgi:hypothetical protein
MEGLFQAGWSVTGMALRAALPDNGSITCPEHAGNYLRCGIEAEPKATVHHTPLGTWYHMAPIEVANFQEFLRSMGKGNDASVCEECRGWA